MRFLMCIYYRKLSMNSVHVNWDSIKISSLLLMIGIRIAIHTNIK